MKSLVVFYSRSGITKKAAEAISDKLKCDIEEIFDTKDRSGVKGYLLAGKDAVSKKLTVIKDAAKNPSEYDMIIIGTPVWAFTTAPAIRTYILQNKQAFKNVAFFCTQGGSGSKPAFKEMQALCGQEPVALLELFTKEVANKEFLSKVEKFVAVLA